jgi:curved DNA-binding protein CbpA
MPPQQPDYYALLGVGRGASAAEVDRAYRRAARATHPDIHPDDASATERFRDVTSAYETLSDPERRASYDSTQPSASPRAAVRIVVRRPQSAAPVHLGRQPPGSRPLQPLRTSPTTWFADDLLELAEALARMIGDWPFR